MFDFEKANELLDEKPKQKWHETKEGKEGLLEIINEKFKFDKDGTITPKNQESQEIVIPSSPQGWEIEEQCMYFNAKVGGSITTLMLDSKDVQVNNIEDATQALSMALQARKLATALHDSRKEIIKPQMDFQRSINKLTADYADKLKEIEEKLKVKLEQWIEKDDTESFTKLNNLSVDDGSMKRVDKWDYEVMDTVDIPFEYLCADTEEIAKAVKNGVREIPGVKIFLKQELSFRVKN